MTREEAIKILTGYMGGKIDPESAELYHAIEFTVDILESHPSLPSNLNEAAEETAQKYYCSCLEKHNETGICDGCENVKLSFKAGAEWMAGQFHKVEGDLVDWYSTSDGKDYCCGVKTDESFEIPEGFYIRKK